MTRDINIRGFTGMSNLKDTGRFWGDPENGLVEPRIILNADVGVSAGLHKRTGVAQRVALPGAHSLWGGKTCMLCVAGNTLYRIRNNAAVSIQELNGVEVPVSYEEVGGVVYFSNQYNTGVFDPDTDTVSPWGVPLPPSPAVIICGGGLPAGAYHVTLTTYDGELSGNGPIVKIELPEAAGIEVLNRPASAVVWVTDANESIFYNMGFADRVVAMGSFEPLPSFMCMPPVPMTQLCHAFGRMWGAVEDKLVYSEPYQLGWFKPTLNYFELDAEIVIIAKVLTGLFVGTRKSTRFFQGTVPEDMQQSDAGAASIPGTLAYANNLPELGDILGTPEKGYVDVPIWRTTEGIVAGNVSGRLFNLTKHKLRLGNPNWGAALYRTVGGVFQYITTAEGVSKGDPVTDEVFKSGTLDSSSAGFNDYATCEVRRGGRLI